MGRSKEVEKKKIQYKKIGGGSARLVLGGRKKIVKPNERFWAYPEDIPEGFKDVILPLDGDVSVKVGTTKTPVKVEDVFKVKVRPKNANDPDPGETKKGKARKWYNVVNKDNGEIINPDPLTEGKANKLAQGLNAE